MSTLLLKLIGVSFLLNPTIAVDQLGMEIIPPPVEMVLEQSEEVTAETYLIYDLNSEGIIVEKNGEVRRPMASLTKLMTALVIMENHQPGEKVSITKSMLNIEPVKIWLMENEGMSVQNLMRALLIPSANDAALALSIYDAGSMENFVEKMNKRAESLGLKNTHYQNPHGLDDEAHYSSAKDIALLTTYLIKLDNEDWGNFFTKTVTIKNTSVSSTDRKFTHNIENSNELLWSDLPIYGVKTGTTDEAGQCLVIFYNDGQKRLLLVIMGSKDRYGDAKLMLGAL